MGQVYKQSTVYHLFVWGRCVFVGVCCWLVVFTALVAVNIVVDSIPSDTMAVISMIPFLLLVFLSIHKSINIATTSITVGEDGIFMRSGYIPWSKSEHYIPYGRIYQSGAVAKGFFNWLFKVGTVVVEQHGTSASRRRSISWMKRPYDIVRNINSYIDAR